MSEGIITKLEVQRRNKERVNVYLDDEFAFGLALIEAAKLRKGQKLTESEIEALRDEDTIHKAFDRAVQYLARRPRSRTEIRRYLSKKEYPDDVADVVIDRLVNMKYLDDESFTRFWVENRTTHQPRGKQALRYELRQKGVAREVIDRVLEEMVEENEGAYIAAQPRIRRLRGITPYEFRKKLGGFLQRRGYPYGVINQTIDDIIAELGEDEPDFFGSEDENE